MQGIAYIPIWNIFFLKKTLAFWKKYAILYNVRERAIPLNPKTKRKNQNERSKDWKSNLDG